MLSSRVSFRDRYEVAGELLAHRLLNEHARNARGVVVAISPGGVQVAYAIAEELTLPLELCSSGSDKTVVPDVAGKDAIALLAQSPAKLTVAVPFLPTNVAHNLRCMAAEVVALNELPDIQTAQQWSQQAERVDGTRVLSLLEKSAKHQTERAQGQVVGDYGD
ncbi:hypothetical protein RI367_002849 [Sorochytrium milnesiophthora]